MAFSHGKNAVISVDDSAGSPTAITNYTEEVSWPIELETGEVTNFGSGGTKEYIPGLSDSTISLSGKNDPTLNTLMGASYAAFIAGTQLTASVEWGPAGSGTGAPKFTAEAILTSYEASSSVSDPNEWSAEYQVTGPVTIGTYA